MAIVDVIDSWQDRSLAAEVDVDGASGEMERVFDVRFDNADPPHLRPLLALTAAGVPAWWDAIDESYPYWFVRRKRVRAGKGPLDYRVAVIYEYFDDPLSRPAIVTWRRQTVTEPIDRDADGEPLTNSADEPFDPAVTEEYYDRIMRIEVNQADFNTEAVEPYVGAINSVAWTPACVGRSFDAYTARCLSIDGDPQRVGTIDFYRAVYEFAIRDDGILVGETKLGWRRRFQDMGFREKIDGEYYTLLDADDNPLTQPVPLDGSGQRLGAAAEPVWRVFVTKRPMDFAGLSL